MRTKSIIVWDPMIRFFHWSLVTIYIVAYFTQEQDYGLHLLAGYYIFALIFIRVIWGFLGTHYARFKNFVYNPKTIWCYCVALIHRKPQHYTGHNPAGGLMVIILLVCLLVICVSGVALDAAENRSGPLAGTQLFLYADSVVTIHIISTYVSIGLIGLHVSGVLFSSVLNKENLVRAMITGKKSVQE